MNDSQKFLDKNNDFGFKHCPLCKSELVKRVLDGHSRLVCSSDKCSFVYYHNPVPAAGAIVVKDEKILLVKRAHEPKINFWCLPAGFMEWQEHPSQTAVREVAEETGLEIELLSLFDVYSGTDDPRTNAILILYLAKEVGGKMAASDDALDVDYFAFEKIPSDLAFEAHRRAVKDYLIGRNNK